MESPIGNCRQCPLVFDMLAKNEAKSVLGTLSLLVTLGILVCTLWPFNPFPRNKVSWLKESNGIRFGWAGVVLSSAALAPGDSSLNQPASLEIWITPSETGYVYTIVDFYTPEDPFRFRLRQYHDGLILSRTARRVDDKFRRIKVDLDHGLQPGKLTLITITSSEDGTLIYLDGELREIYPNFRFTSGDLSGRIVLGTAPVDSEPWIGEIHGMAVYSTALSAGEVQADYQWWTRGAPTPISDLDSCMARYTFGERNGREIHNQVSTDANLEIPVSFRVPMKALLKSPWSEFELSPSYFADAFRNVLGFIPFGFIVCAYLFWTRASHKVVWLTVLAGGTFSLFIEIVQAYIPQRVSDTTDVITNIVGTALGALLVIATPVRNLLVRTGIVPVHGIPNRN